MVQGVDVDDPEVKLVRKSSVEEPFSALAFKIATDPFLGSLTFIRVYSGAPPLRENAHTRSVLAVILSEAPNHTKKIRRGA